MPNWFRKTLVALITVFTFGLVTPPSILLDNAKVRTSLRAQLGNKVWRVRPIHMKKRMTG